jgi:hypothetical protein
MRSRSLLLLLLATLSFTGCAESFMIYHSQTGEPLLIGRRSYSYDGCFSTMREESERLGVTFRYIQVRGSVPGRSLLWPFEPGYACEAAIGPERPPTGIYLNVPPLSPQG